MIEDELEPEKRVKWKIFDASKLSALTAAPLTSLNKMLLLYCRNVPDTIKFFAKFVAEP